MSASVIHGYCTCHRCNCNLLKTSLHRTYIIYYYYYYYYVSELANEHLSEHNNERELHHLPSLSSSLYHHYHHFIITIIITLSSLSSSLYRHYHHFIITITITVYRQSSLPQDSDTGCYRTHTNSWITHTELPYVTVLRRVTSWDRHVPRITICNRRALHVHF